MPNPLASAHILSLLAISAQDATAQAARVAHALDRLPVATSREAVLDPVRWGRAVAVLLPSLTRDQRVRVLAPIKADQSVLTLLRHIIHALPHTGQGVGQAFFALLSTITRVVCGRDAESESQQQEMVRDLLDLMPLVQPIGRRIPLLDRAYKRVVLLDECDLRDAFLERIRRGFADYGYGMSAYRALWHMSDSTAKANAL